MILYSCNLVFVCVIGLCTVHIGVVREPIPVGQLASYVDRLHMNENCEFGEEYKV